MFSKTLLGFSFYDILFYFITYAFIGWLLEVLYAYKNNHKFINRGFLHGPICPIYGFGATLIVLILNGAKNNIFLLFIYGTILTTLLEYITAVILENAFKTKWWDYSDNSFNFQGRVCPLFSLIWGIASVIVIKIVQPIVALLISKIPFNIGIFIYYIIIISVFVDLFFTISSLINIKNLMKKIKQYTSLIENKIDNIFIKTKYNLNLQNSYIDNKYSFAGKISLNNIKSLRNYTFSTPKKISLIIQHLKDKFFNNNCN